jgi:cellulose/xylan binding protein with CBM9 domain/F5/8 type C domain-containing protein
MYRLIVTATVIFCNCIILLTPAVAGFPHGGYSARVPRLTTAPVIDGDLKDTVWEQAAVLGKFVQVYEEKQAKIQTRARVGYDNENLYIAVECSEPLMDNIVVQPRKNDGKVWRDDCIEILIDPDNNNSDYFHLALNSAGSVYDGFISSVGPVPASEWDCGWKVKTSRKKDGWIAEIAIPFSNLMLTPEIGGSWGFNIFRVRYAGGESEVSWWSPPYRKGLKRPEKKEPELCGQLTNIEIDIERFASKEPVITYQKPAPPKDARIYVGDKNELIVDGKPFFSIGYFASFPGDAQRVKKQGCNSLHTYITEGKKRHHPKSAKISPLPWGKEALDRWLKEADDNNIKALISPYADDALLHQKTAEYVHLTVQEEQKLREFIQRRKGQPALLAWYIDDEPYNRGRNPLRLREIYEVFKDADPYHPVAICDEARSWWKGKGYYAYLPSCDIVIPNPFITFREGQYDTKYDLDKKITRNTLTCVEGSKGKKAVWPLLMAGSWDNWDWDRNFGYRGPTFKEMRAQVYLEVINGAKGLWFYNAKLCLEPEMIVGLEQSIIPELQGLSRPILCGENENVNITQEGDAVRGIGKKDDPDLYLFTVNTENHPTKASFNVPHNGELYVVSEGRTVVAKNGLFTDEFDSYGVHIYTTAKKRPTFKTLNEIEHEIVKLKEKLMKPGNVASKYAGATANCSPFELSRAPYVLIDGLSSGNSLWIDKTPNELPDWIEVTFQKEEKISRVVVYHETLKKYNIQYWDGNDWQSVEGTGVQMANHVIHRFEPVKTTKIRLWITEVEGSFTKIYEIEAYRE